MLKLLSRNVLKLAARSKRYCSCWCPEETFDEFTRCSYLPNGVRVITEENCSSLACISLFIIAGSRYETAYNHGVTHFIEHMAYKGFKSMGRIQLECEVLNMGARMDAKTDREMQYFSILLPACAAPFGIEYLCKIVSDLELNNEALDQEKYNLCLELMDADIDPKAVMFEYLHATAFQGTPLGQPVIGNSRSMCKYDTAMVGNYLTDNYTTCKLIVATSGGVSHDDLLPCFGKTFGLLLPSTGVELDPGPCRFTSSQVLYRNDDMPLAHVAVAFEAPGFTSPDFITMLVMNCMMGSWHRSMDRPVNQPFGMSKWASATNACESYEPFYIVYKDVGLWGMYFVAEGLNLDDMIIFMQSAFVSMAVTTHSYEVERARNMAKLKIAKRFSGVVNSSRDIGMQVLHTCSRTPVTTFLERIDGVTSYVIREAAAEYLYNKSPAVSGVGPTEGLTDYARIENGMYWLRW